MAMSTGLRLVGTLLKNHINIGKQFINMITQQRQLVVDTHSPYANTNNNKNRDCNNNQNHIPCSITNYGQS
ncbi:hypothetical protein [Pragia fontium]|uniref:hypothetical protein n=1 Tax=Pragia fontium TaxID=82985 RepID=UPI00064A8638|nr:hypothetical protein [Pragia fontium]AKJ40711.1 hypothetical protein QQ39_00345 [Pragia fontium]